VAGMENKSKQIGFRKQFKKTVNQIRVQFELCLGPFWCQKRPRVFKNWLRKIEFSN
jgi:hypothetical protein